MSTITTPPASIPTASIDPTQATTTTAATTTTDTTATAATTTSALAEDAVASGETLASLDTNALADQASARLAKSPLSKFNDEFAKQISDSIPERPSFWHRSARKEYDKQLPLVQQAATACVASARELSGKSLESLKDDKMPLIQFMVDQSKLQSALHAMIKATNSENPVLLQALIQSEFRSTEAMNVFDFIDRIATIESDITLADGTSTQVTTTFTPQNSALSYQAGMTIDQALAQLSEKQHAQGHAKEQLASQAADFIKIMKDAKPEDLPRMIGDVDTLLKDIDTEIAMLSGDTSARREGDQSSVRLHVENLDTEALLALKSELTQAVSNITSLREATNPATRIAEMLKQSLMTRIADEDLKASLTTRTLIQGITPKSPEAQAKELTRVENLNKYIALGLEILAELEGAEDLAQKLTEEAFEEKIYQAFDLLKNGIKTSKMPTSGELFFLHEAIATLRSPGTIEGYVGEVFKGTSLNLQAIIEAKLRSIPAEHVISENITFTASGSASGAVNTVRFLSHTDASALEHAYVFKAEADAQKQISVSAGQFGANVIKLNIASQVVADAIGCASIIPTSKLVIHEGSVGFAMSKAKGAPMDELASGKKVFTVKSDTGEEVKLSFQETVDFLKGKGLYDTMRQNLARELCKLEWADALSGQLDRHRGNYMVDINERAEVTITAIDNDLSFAALKTGMYSYDMRAERTGTIPDPYNIVGRTFTFLSTNPDIPSRPDAKDSSTEVARSESIIGTAILTCIACNNASIPTHIPQEVYTALMAINEDSYRASLEGLLKTEQLESAVSRLKDAKVHAQMLSDQGRLIADWSTLDFTQFEPSRLTEQSSMEYQVQGHFVADFLSQCGPVAAILPDGNSPRTVAA